MGRLIGREADDRQTHLVPQVSFLNQHGVMDILPPVHAALLPSFSWMSSIP